MKPFWIACTLLAAMLGLLGFHARYLENTLAPLTQTLAQAEQQAQKGDWQSAAAQTEQVQKTLEQHRFYLRTTLPHRELDAISLLFAEVLALQKHELLPDYQAKNATLRSSLHRLCEMEQLSLVNLF